MRAEHDHRHGSAAHNQAQCFQAIHSRHFQVERDDVWMELFDFLQRDGAIHQDGSSAHQVAGDNFGGKCLDHQLLFADHAVDDKTETLFGGTDHDDEIALFLFCVRSAYCVNSAQAIQTN